MKRKKGWAVQLCWEDWTWEWPASCSSSSSSFLPPARLPSWAGWRWTVTGIQPWPTIRWGLGGRLPGGDQRCLMFAGYLWLSLPAVSRSQGGGYPVPHQDDPRHALQLWGGGLPVDNSAQHGTTKSKPLFPLLSYLSYLSTLSSSRVRRDWWG